MQRFVNNFKTALLLGGLFALILFIGSLWGREGLVIAFFFGLATNFFAYFFSDKLAIAAMRGQQVDERSYPDLVHMVERLARNANLPMPRVYVTPHDAPNAFATGRNPKNAAVAVTQGALRLLDYDELEGVMAHELAHVKNRDTLISAVAATIAGAINFLAWMAMWERDMHPLVRMGLFILAPIAAAVIQMAISRSREFVADHDAATMVGSPHGLISALRKLDGLNKRIPMQGEAPTYNHMFIVQPLNMAQGLTKLFSTHPPMEERISALQKLA